MYFPGTFTVYAYNDQSGRRLSGVYLPYAVNYWCHTTSYWYRTARFKDRDAQHHREHNTACYTQWTYKGQVNYHTKYSIPVQRQKTFHSTSMRVQLSLSLSLPLSTDMAIMNCFAVVVPTASKKNKGSFISVFRATFIGFPLFSPPVN